jgi:hypothetical protein
MNTSIENIVTSREFGTIGVAVLSSGICVIIKIISRSRKHKVRILNEFNVGLEMTVTAIFLMVAMSTNHFAFFNRPGIDESVRQGLNVDFEISQLEVLGFVVVLLSTSLVVSFLGWKNKNDLHGFWGIFLPDLIGVLSICYVLSRY